MNSLTTRTTENQPTSSRPTTATATSPLTASTGDDPPIGLTGQAKQATAAEVESTPAMQQQQQQSQHQQVQQQQRSKTRPSRSGSAGLLQVPTERYGNVSKQRSSGHKTTSQQQQQQPQDPATIFEEDFDVIRNCRALSSAVLGLMKSFSTSDICSLNDTQQPMVGFALRQTVSEMLLGGGLVWNPKFDLPNIRRLDCTSRSLSTWVAVGDPVSSASQLPSPSAQPTTSNDGFSQPPTTITAIDFVRSVNKKVRQMYIRRRLLSTYRAIGRLSRSQVNVNETTSTPIVGATSGQPTVPVNLGLSLIPNVQIQDLQSSTKNMCLSFDLDNLCFKTMSGSLCLTAKDIERDKGKPLTKYERNIMIFNWLQNLDEEESQPAGETSTAGEQSTSDTSTRPKTAT